MGDEFASTGEELAEVNVIWKSLPGAGGTPVMAAAAVAAESTAYPVSPKITASNAAWGGGNDSREEERGAGIAEETEDDEEEGMSLLAPAGSEFWFWFRLDFWWRLDLERGEI